jgi:hypothetical protein
MGSVRECTDEGTDKTVDAHSFSKQDQEIETNAFEPKNDGYSALGPQGNFVDGIHGTRDHNNVSGLL